MPKPRDYGREYQTYAGKPDQLKRRASRNAARREMEKMLGREALRGKDVDHCDGNPLNNNKSNLRVKSKTVNRKKK